MINRIADALSIHIPLINIFISASVLIIFMSLAMTLIYKVFLIGSSRTNHDNNEQVNLEKSSDSAQNDEATSDIQSADQRWSTQIKRAMLKENPLDSLPLLLMSYQEHLFESDVVSVDKAEYLQTIEYFEALNSTLEKIVENHLNRVSGSMILTKDQYQDVKNLKSCIADLLRQMKDRRSDTISWNLNPSLKVIKSSDTLLTAKDVASFATDEFLRQVIQYAFSKKLFFINPKIRLKLELAKLIVSTEHVKNGAITRKVYLNDLNRFLQFDEKMSYDGHRQSLERLSSEVFLSKVSLYQQVTDEINKIENAEETLDYPALAYCDELRNLVFRMRSLTDPVDESSELFSKPFDELVEIAKSLCENQEEQAQIQVISDKFEKLVSDYNEIRKSEFIDQETLVGLSTEFQQSQMNLYEDLIEFCKSKDAEKIRDFKISVEMTK